MGESPFVSVIMTAHDGAAGLAASLDAALAQDFPAERLEIVVVSDGGGHAAAVTAGYAELFPARVRVVVEPGAGAVAAITRALGEARGELLALLEPGVRWPAGRVSAQVAALGEWADAGLVYSELAGVEEDPPHGQPVARLLREPPSIAPSSIMLRAALLPAIGPLPDELPRAPWWIAVRAACVSEIAFAPAGVATPVEADGAAEHAAPRADALREALAVQRWFLTHVTSESRYADAVGEIWESFLANARRLVAAADDPFAELVTVTDADRSDARRMLADARAALEHGDTWPAATLAVRAAALDPWCAPARALLAETLAGRPRRATGDPLAGARRFVTLAFAEELLHHRELLEAYGSRFDGGADATLAIDASTLLPAAVGRALAALVSDLGLDADGTAHMVAVLGPIEASVRAQLPQRADALLTLRGRSEDAPTVPAFDADSIDELHALARRANAA
jgi:hypothetical protein